jgi:hypothetical protein
LLSSYDDKHDNNNNNNDAGSSDNKLKIREDKGQEETEYKGNKREDNVSVLPRNNCYSFLSAVNTRILII